MTWVQIPLPVGENPADDSHDLAPPPSLSMLLSTRVQCEDREVLILQGSERLMNLCDWKEPAAGAGSDHLFLLPSLFSAFLPFSVLLPGHGKVCPKLFLRFPT